MWTSELVSLIYSHWLRLFGLTSSSFLSLHGLPVSSEHDISPDKDICCLAHFRINDLGICAKKQFSVESECNQARFKCWHILFPKIIPTVFVLLLAVVATIPHYYTPPRWHSPRPTKSLSAGQLCRNAQGHLAHALPSFSKIVSYESNPPHLLLWHHDFMTFVQQQ